MDAHSTLSGCGVVNEPSTLLSDEFSWFLVEVEKNESDRRGRDTLLAGKCE